MGFFNPMAAFITGAATQANENIERGRLEDRQDDLIWANKFERGRAEYEKERKSASEQTKFYNTLLKTFGNNAEAADMAFQISGKDPKHAMQAISWVSENLQKGAFGNDTTKPGTSLQDIQENLANKYQNLQEIRGNAREGSIFRQGNPYAKNAQMPPAPYGNSEGTSGTLPPGTSIPITPELRDKLERNSTPPLLDDANRPKTGPFSDPGTPPSAPIGVTTPAGVGPGSTPGSPTPLVPKEGPGSTPNGSIPPSAGASGPTTASGAPTVTSPDVIPAPVRESSQPGTQVAQAQPPINPATGRPFITPYRSPETQRQADQTRLAQQLQDQNWQIHQDNMAKQQAMQTERLKQAEQFHKDNFELEKLKTNPEYQDQQANRQIAVDDTKKYLHAAKDGLQARYSELPGLQTNNFDLDQLQTLMDKGLKAGPTQELKANVNRFVHDVFGTDLADLKVDVNSIVDTNTARKAVSNAMIERLKTLHFGRITNYEAQYVNKGLPNEGADPDTNLKILLTLKAGIDYEKNVRTAEYDAVYGPNATGSLVDRAMAARQASLKSWQAFDKSAPYPVIRDASPSDTLQKAMQLPPNTWFEDLSGKMFKIVDNQNGQITLQNSAGARIPVNMGP